MIELYGFGPAFERDPLNVAKDVRQGLVSIEGALLDYGVVISDDGTLTIDKAATAKARSAA